MSFARKQFSSRDGKKREPEALLTTLNFGGFS
jgi:hypothetical protein